MKKIYFYLGPITKDVETRPDTRPIPVADGWAVACTEMTINNKIRILQVVLVVGLSWASNGINFGLKNLHLAVRALP